MRTFCGDSGGEFFGWKGRGSAMEKTFSQSELEAIAQALADTSDGLTGSEIGHILASLKMADPTPQMTKWKRLHNAFVERQNFSRNRRAVVQFIREAMKPERYARQAERFEPMRANVNRALAFVGMAVNVDGTVAPADRVGTLSEARRRAQELRADLVAREVHPDVLTFCREELLADDYFHAVLEATKSVADKLRNRTGLSDDGGSLVDKALAGDIPMLAINPFKTDSERSEQRGFANLVKGIFGMFRNPTAHAARIHWTMERKDAEDLLSVVSLIHRRIDAA
jgi:uncharacterized protein (TIGR02391 family)